MKLLGPSPGERILDVTVGLGGHSAALLSAAGKGGRLIGMDTDEENLAVAHERLQHLKGQFELIHGNFRSLPGCLPKDCRSFGVVLADLGLSSPHVDDPSRGFSFRGNAPLDMRYDRSEGMTAAMLLASLDRGKLLALFREGGELPRAGSLADAIIARRRKNPVRTSGDLKETADSVYGYRAQSVLPQVFQALRMEVNGEREALESFLSVLPSLLKPGGRCAVISYHSLEDRMVKQAFRALTEEHRDPVTGAITGSATFELLTKRALRPDPAEIVANPRSRSARLRAIRKKELYTVSRSLL